MLNSRNQINSLRGIACIFLVAYHVIGPSEAAGLKVASGPYREINDILNYIRMPIFTFLSGYVYNYRPYSGAPRKFILGKLRRLIVPMLCVGTLFALLQSAVPGSNGEIRNWYMLHILPVAHFWFIESLFLIFMLIMALEASGLLATKLKIFICLAVSAVLQAQGFYLPYFSVMGAIYLLPFFLLGLAIHRHDILQYVNRSSGLACLIALVLILTSIGYQFIPKPDKFSLFSFGIGSLCCIALLALRLEFKFLAWIGVYSYSIYVFHVFFTASMRISFSRIFGISDNNLIFIASLIAGVGLPMILETIFNRFNLTRVLMLGKSKKTIAEQK